MVITGACDLKFDDFWNPTSFLDTENLSLIDKHYMILGTNIIMNLIF